MSSAGQILAQHTVRLFAIDIHERPSRGMMETMESTTRTYRFVVTVEVDPGTRHMTILSGLRMPPMER